MKHLKTQVLQKRCLRASKGMKYICFLQILDLVWKCSGIKSAVLNSSSLQVIWTRLHISSQSKQSVTFQTHGALAYCYLVSSLFISVHIVIYYTLARQVSVFCVWSLFIQCNAVCNATRPCTAVSRRHFSSNQHQWCQHLLWIHLFIMLFLKSRCFLFILSYSVSLWFCSHLLLFINIPITF